MIRPCFLCAHHVEPLYSTRWAMPGLGFKTIGFSICPQCGSVCQSPSVPFEDMMTYYQSIAVYTNPGRQNEPTKTKIRDLDEQIQFVKRGIGHLPNQVLQVGSSDGYTLWRFEQAGSQQVLGIEPGRDSVSLAQEKYGITCHYGTFEGFKTKDSFELIILTHVLEHFFHPGDVLKRCFQLQAPLEEGFLFAEVPLLTFPELLCPGFFSFEHINYYTLNNLRESLQQAGYTPVSWNVHMHSDASPILGMLASTRKRGPSWPFSSEYETNKSLVHAFRQHELETWQSCVDQIAPQLKAAQRVFIWGAGIHTSQLLADTNLLSHCQIDGLVDTSPLKWNLRQGDWICQNPKTIKWQKGDVVLISSYMSEKEIYDALFWLRDKGVATLRLHQVDDTRALS